MYVLTSWIWFLLPGVNQNVSISGLNSEDLVLRCGLVFFFNTDVFFISHLCSSLTVIKLDVKVYKIPLPHLVCEKWNCESLPWVFLLRGELCTNLKRISSVYGILQFLILTKMLKAMKNEVDGKDQVCFTVLYSFLFFFF